MSTVSGHDIPRYESKRNERIDPHTGLYTSVYNSFLCNSPDLETFQVAVNM